MLHLQFPIAPSNKLLFFLPRTHCNGKPVTPGTQGYSHFAWFCNPRFSLLRPRLVEGLKCVASGSTDQEKNEIQLPQGLQPELIPKHVAVVMDGNRRWAKNRRLPVQHGHGACGKAMKQLAINSKKFGVQVLSVFAFSTENWTRPKEEVDFLMRMFEEIITSDMEELIQHGMRMSFLGDRIKLPQSLQNAIVSCTERTKDNKGFHLVMALNYSGQYDITKATKEIARKVRDGLLVVEDIDKALVEQHLETNGIEFSKPDLMIRTSGEVRMSNFMLWQLAYAELIFVEKLFPDFDEMDLIEAITTFQRRQRRYGGQPR